MKNEPKPAPKAPTRTELECGKPEVAAFHEQYMGSVQVEEKGVFSSSSLKTFYQSICHRLKGTSTFRDSKNGHQDLAPLISDICHPLGTSLLHSC